MLSGGLFSRYFLDTGVRTTAAWAALSEQDVADFAAAARADLSAFRAAMAPNEGSCSSPLRSGVCGAGHDAA